jgi:hypothetical protein
VVDPISGLWLKTRSQPKLLVIDSSSKMLIISAGKIEGQFENQNGMRNLKAAQNSVMGMGENQIHIGVFREESLTIDHKVTCNSPT